MDLKALEREIEISRQTEFEIHEEIIRHLREVDRRKLWRTRGFKSLVEFCERQMGYDTEAAVEVCAAARGKKRK